MTSRFCALLLPVVFLWMGCGNGNGGTDPGTLPDPDGGPTSLSGKLGTLGTVKPIVSSWVINNSGETLVYLSSANLTCETMQASRWLGSQPADSQVVEIVMSGTPTNGKTVSVPPGEVNYAAGGKSSSYEVSADSGSIKYTSVTANGPVQGSVHATYSDGSSVTGTFNAEFCANGQQF